METKQVRHEQYAGSFYPAGKKELLAMISKLLKENDFELAIKKAKVNPKNIRAMIVPHAGYIYSGPTAAAGYNALKKTNPKKVILLGPSHQTYIDGAHTFSGKWSTPLGLVDITPARDMHVIEGDLEHSLEVQVPFLQSVLDEFTLTPIIYGDVSPEELAMLVEKDLSRTGKEMVLIASSDLSHYLEYNIAKKVDNATIATIMDIDVEELLRIGDACGIIGIGAILVLAKKRKWTPILLDYRNSGDTAGDKSGVVGYASIVFVD
ncbi:MAG: AmmeMemoRadiSam system protein B [archaeon]